MLIAALLVALTFTLPAAASASEPPTRSYVVLYAGSVADAGAATSRRERSRGFRAKHRYGHAVKGFSARLTRGQVAELRGDPAVALVAPDRPVHADAAVAAGERVPTGIARMGAVSGGRVSGSAGTAVAVLDTGVDLDHPDLPAVRSGENCITPGAPADDDHGHGTHVAGTVAAANGGAGVVGVAPGTTVYAVKVLDATGAGSTSSVICGIDWVTANAATLGIRVANMSLSGSGPALDACPNSADPEHRAVCRGTDAGVTFVAAAGNSSAQFDSSTPRIPAVYPEVLTVTAVSDSDGAPGAAGGAPACRTSEFDDRRASFSNFARTTAGQAHTVAGPGVCILSTWPGGTHRTISGTSMASPAVAGAVALCLDGPCSGLVPRDVIAKVRSDAAAYNADGSFGFIGDPLHPVSTGYFGYLVHAGPPPAPDTVAPGAPTGLAATAGDGQVALRWAVNTESDLAGYRVYRDGARLADSATASFTDSALANGTSYRYTVTAVDRAGNESAASAEVSATPAAQPIGLTARPYRVKGVAHTELRWTEAGGAADVYRNGALIKASVTTTSHTDRLTKSTTGSVGYRVCRAGRTANADCSATVTVIF